MQTINIRFAYFSYSVYIHYNPEQNKIIDEKKYPSD